MSPLVDACAVSASECVLRGIELRAKHQMAECLHCFQRALTLDPNSGRVRYELACAQLLTGSYLDGFRNYESRWEAAGLPRPVCTDGPLLGKEWRGQDLVGKRFLLHAEQGFGDTVQFIRYAPLVAALGADVTIEVQPALRGLAACITNGCKVGNGVPDGSFDFHRSLIDLPAVFRTSVNTVPPPAMIRIPKEIEQEWRARIGATKRTKIGLVWAGNPKNSTDATRSIKLDLLRPILDSFDHAEFFSFQLGKAAEQVSQFEKRVSDLQPYLRTFADTAGALMQMDRIISVDTGVAHLAASLGLKVWLLLSYTPCWRWLLDTRHSPWYPTMSLVRQPSPGDWERVISNLQKELYNTK